MMFRKSPYGSDGIVDGICSTIGRGGNDIQKGKGIDDAILTGRQNEGSIGRKGDARNGTVVRRPDAN